MGKGGREGRPRGGEGRGGEGRGGEGGEGGEAEGRPRGGEGRGGEGRGGEGRGGEGGRETNKHHGYHLHLTCMVGLRYILLLVQLSSYSEILTHFLNPRVRALPEDASKRAEALIRFLRNLRYVRQLCDTALEYSISPPYYSISTA